jgi:hypothetical protein
MMRELRGADQVVDMTGNAVDVIVSLNGTLLRVRYDCDVAVPDESGQPRHDTYRRCVRREAAATPGEDPPACPRSRRRHGRRPHLPGTSATTCDSAAACAVFTCHSEDGRRSRLRAAAAGPDRPR